MAKDKAFVCSNCGYDSVKWLGNCPSCNEWNTFKEIKLHKEKSRKVIQAPLSDAIPISKIQAASVSRFLTGMSELDNVLGGGIVPGSVILLGGEPGVGKSTLMLQVSENLSKLGKILYVSGEESGAQIKMRSSRLGVKGDKVYFSGETSLENIYKQIEKDKPDFLVVDSIQTCYTSAHDKSPGSIVQVREVTNRLLEISKTMGIATIIIGHVTKEGNIAGPKILEHIVDTVLYFESNSPYLILRSVKNRFGNTDEIGIFLMQEAGVTEVTNPHEVFLDETQGEGIAVACVIEGTRALMLEVQALISTTAYASPRRLVDGVELNKVNKIIAVMEKHLGLNLSTKDVYINLVGGIKVKEPAIDLAITCAVLSSLYRFTVNKKWAFIGELGLTGEIRKVSFLKERVNEAAKMGIEKIILPGKGLEKESLSEQNVKGIKSIIDLINLFNLKKG